MKTIRISTLLLACLLGTAPLKAQNYDETKVPVYTLPHLLTAADGTPVTSAKQWKKQRRPELMELLATHGYGHTPQEQIAVKHEIIQENPQALGGRATQQQVKFTFSGQGKTIEALLLVYYPNQRKGKVPVFICYNFKGNHSTSTDEQILYSPYFEQLPNRQDPILVRGNQSSRWSIPLIIDRGYAVATMCYHDIYPDHKQGESESVLSLFPADTYGKPDSWQALGAWAWGSSRIADWVERQPWANKKQLAIMGHSRQGKAALWAGAQDERFQVVISNNSGCGGAALSRREFGETVAKINSSFPHWFCRNFASYGKRVNDLPFDQHTLLAMVAPRHLYVASAEQDQWADPRGEFMATYEVGAVYELFGMEGLPSPIMPDIHRPMMTDVGYHYRAGKHDVTEYDWARYIDFCDKVFER